MVHDAFRSDCSVLACKSDVVAESPREEDVEVEAAPVGEKVERTGVGWHVALADIAHIAVVCDLAVTVAVDVADVAKVEGLVGHVFWEGSVVDLFLSLEEAVSDKTVFRADLFTGQTLVFGFVIRVGCDEEVTSVGVRPNEFSAVAEVADSVSVSESQVEAFVIIFVEIGRAIMETAHRRWPGTGIVGKNIVLIFVEYVKLDAK